MKAVVAMSGGVDSSLAAALTLREGFEAVGVTLKLLARTETGFGCCGSPADIDDAKRVCEQLGIAHYTLNLSDLFEDKVIRPFVESYLRSRTPNPCAECNRSLKFGHLLALARAWGAQALATGHYARRRDGRLYRPKDLEKDQTYFLYNLGPSELAMARFPLGELTKPEVRRLAKELGLKTADKPESQEICFIPRRDYRGFIESRDRAGAPAFGAPGVPPPLGTGSGLLAGPIENSRGERIGRHKGLASYTIGQRKGLAIAPSSPRPYYVVALKPETNTLVAGSDEETKRRSCLVQNVSWTTVPPSGELAASARIRHRHPPAPARLAVLDNGDVRVDFEEAQRAVTPGQSAVFYRGDEVLGGGIIANEKN